MLNRPRESEFFLNTSVDHINTTIILDETCSSNLLHQKLSDLTSNIKQDVFAQLKFNPNYLKQMIFQKQLIDLKRDRQFIILFLQINGEIINYMPEEIQFDKRVAEQLFINNGLGWNWFVRKSKKKKENIGMIASGKQIHHYSPSSCSFGDLKRIYGNTRHDLFSDKNWIIYIMKNTQLMVLYNIPRFKYMSLFSILSVEMLPPSLRQDKELATIYGMEHVSLLGYFDESLRLDRNIMLEIVKKDPYSVFGLDRSLYDDWEIFFESARQIGSFDHLQTCQYNEMYGKWRMNILKNLDSLMKWINDHPKDYFLLNFAARIHPSIALIAIKKGVLDLTILLDHTILMDEPYFGDSLSLLKKSEEIFKLAVQKNPRYIKIADESLKRNKNYILQLIEIDPNVIQYIDMQSSLLNDDSEIAKQVVSRKGCLLNLFSNNIKSNYEIVMLAVTESAQAIQFSLIHDIDIVMKAIESDGTTLQYLINTNLMENREIVLTAIRQNGHALKFVQNHLVLDREIVKEALNNGCPYIYIETTLRKDRELALVAIRNDSRAFRYVDESIRNDVELFATFSNSNSWWNIKP